MLLYGCPPCDPVLIDHGHLPENALFLVPYVDGQAYRFRHSEGLVINYSASRETRQEVFYAGDCSYEYMFEINTSTLTPDYPVFTFVLEIVNPDTSLIACNVRFGHNYFNIPSNQNFSNLVSYVDSLLIEDKYYYQVFRLKNNSYHAEMDSIYADSLYYNYAYGILQIKMTNGERYTILE